MNSTCNGQSVLCVKQRSDHTAGAIQYLGLLSKHFCAENSPLALAEAFLINVKVLHMHVAPGSWKRERDPLELESQVVVSHHVSAGDQMRIL